MILLIDTYDSFSYNLYQMIGEFDPEIKVIRNDEMTVEEIRACIRTVSSSLRDRADRRMRGSSLRR